MNHRWKRGSLTIEAALLLPLALSVCALLVWYCFYEHNRVWYRAAACETALVGTKRTEAGEDRLQMAVSRAEKRAEEQPFPGKKGEAEVRVDKRSCSVTYTVAMDRLFPWDFSCRLEEKVERKDPVGRIRTIWLAKQIMNGGEG